MVRGNGPAGDGIVKDEGPAKAAAVEDGIVRGDGPAGDGIVKDEGPAEDTAVKDGIVRGDGPAGDDIVKDEGPAEDAAVKDDGPVIGLGGCTAGGVEAGKRVLYAGLKGPSSARVGSIGVGC
jgi:hypothetical protein